MPYPNYDQLLRFELIYGQYFAEYVYKNLNWRLNDEPIGFGDLRAEDIGRIAKKLHEDEEFVGWNEHHGTQFQQTNTPMIRIKQEFIALREDIVKAEGR